MRRLAAVGVLALASGLLIGHETAPPDCPPGQTLQGDLDQGGFAWWYCEPNVPPCPEEDSPGPCFWDAETRGNERGESFIVP